MHLINFLKNYFLKPKAFHSKPYGFSIPDSFSIPDNGKVFIKYFK